MSSEVSDLFGSVLRRKLAAQPWYRQHANTLTAAVTGLLTLVWWAISSGIQLNEQTQVGVGLLLWLAQALGVGKTPDALTSKTVDSLVSDVDAAVGRHSRRDV